MTEKKARGFATMDRKLVSEIARKGGIAAHQQGTAHTWTVEEARKAGRRGAAVSHQRRRERLEADDLGRFPTIPCPPPEVRS